MKVKILNKSNNPLPQYETEGAAGVDLRANIPDTAVLYPGKRMLVPTGLHMEMPEGYELQIRARSGLAAKFGISVLNAPGTIDYDFRGDIGVILINLGSEPFVINPGDRIAQGVFNKYERAEFVEVSNDNDLSITERACRGIGHTGTN